MAMAAEWPVARRVTRLEHQVAHAAADLLESWARRIVRQSKNSGERRAASRSYDEDLERFARQAVEGGVPVTAVVLSFSDSALRPGVTQTRIEQTVRTSVSHPALYTSFNPFTTTPVQGVNWDYAPTFGTALNRLAFTSPRMFRISFGVRF